MEIASYIVKNYTITEIILLVISLSLVMWFFYIVSSPDYYSKRDEIRSKYKKKLRKEVRLRLQAMVHKACGVAREIGHELTIECNKSCGLDPVEVQVNSYCNTMRLAVKDFLMDDVLVALYENGFHDKSQEMLNLYLSGRGAIFYGDVLLHVEKESANFPAIFSNARERSSVKEATEIYRGLVSEYLELHEKEEREVERLRKRYTIRGRIKNMVESVKGAI